jgi:hypothetical protein
VDPNGKVNVVEYTAGQAGFRVLGANNLPVAPEVPATPELKAPEPVQDTPEVRIITIFVSYKNMITYLRLMQLN